MMVSRRAFTAIGAVWFCIAGLAPATASAFGTVNILGQRGEHERITRLALGCRAGQPHDGSCFEAASLNNVAGTSGTFGAVGAPDDIPLRLSGGPFYWHCDDADYLATPGYPQSRAKATETLNACRQWARDMLFDGRPDHTLGRTWPVQGAVATARTLLDSKGNVDVTDPGTGFFSPSCTFDGTLGRAKCNVWEPFGYVLHVTEDFYSHSNWADLSNPNQAISITNPPGLGHRDPARLLGSPDRLCRFARSSFGDRLLPDLEVRGSHHPRRRAQQRQGAHKRDDGIRQRPDHPAWADRR